MHQGISFFFTDERGAISVDWVVLTSGCIAMALAVIFMLTDGVETRGTAASERMSAYEIDDTFDSAD